MTGLARYTYIYAPGCSLPPPFIHLCPLHFAFSSFNSSVIIYSKLYEQDISEVNTYPEQGGDDSTAKSSDPWLFHNWELRPPIQFSGFVLCNIRFSGIFLEHLHGLSAMSYAKMTLRSRQRGQAL